MPHLKIETNVVADKIPKEAVTELVAALAKTVGKPTTYCACTIVPGLMMSMDLDPSVPCAQATLTCIGKLGLEENKVHAANLFPLFKKYLGVDEDKCYIHFIDAKTQDIGFKSTTFHEILGK